MCAADNAEVEILSTGALCNVTGVETRSASLDNYRTELALVESRASVAMMQVVKAAKGLGIRAMKRNIGINPSGGVVGGFVEFRPKLTPERRDELLEVLNG